MTKNHRFLITTFYRSIHFQERFERNFERITSTVAALVLVGASVCVVNGQELWVDQSPSDLKLVSSVSFVDSLTGYLGGLGFVLKTTNGGSDWMEVLQVPGENQVSIHALNADTVHTLSGLGGVSRMTVNGGANWEASTVETTFLAAIHFNHRGIGLVVGDGLIARTTDGLAWSKVLDVPGELLDVQFVTDSVAWATGFPGLLYRSDDAGVSWSFRDNPVETSGGRSVSFLGEYGWLASPNVVFGTSDSGETWDLRDEFSGTDTGISDLHFTSPLVGWMALDRDVYKTSDGGKTWALSGLEAGLAAGGRGAINRVFFATADRGWAVGGNFFNDQRGVIFHTGMGSVVTSEPVDYRGLATQLLPNYPNPLAETTTISYALPEATTVTLTVIDVLGRDVRELASDIRPAGTHEVYFDATGLSSGLYFYRLIAGDYVETKRMVVVR